MFAQPAYWLVGKVPGQVFLRNTRGEFGPPATTLDLYMLSLLFGMMFNVLVNGHGQDSQFT